jgi:hypothetical protein
MKVWFCAGLGIWLIEAVRKDGLRMVACLVESLGFGREKRPWAVCRFVG